MRRQEIDLMSGYPITVSDIVDMQQRVPTIDGDIPFGVDLKLPEIKSSVEITQPTLDKLDEQTVDFRLGGRPFGFFKLSETGERILSQRTDSITLLNPQRADWRVALETPESLSCTDIALISGGMGVYLNYIASSVAKTK